MEQFHNLLGSMSRILEVRFHTKVFYFDGCLANQDNNRLRIGPSKYLLKTNIKK